NLTCIDPVAAKTINKNLLEELKNSGQNSMKAEEYAKRTLGVLDEKSKEIIEKLPFKSDVITLSEFKKHIGENLFEKAENMSKLQPKLAGEGAVLTKQQAIDVLKNGSINSDKFMNTIFNEKFKENLTNPNKYIPMKQITNFRENIDKYTQGVINAAEKSNHGFVDEKLLNHINKKSFMMTAGFRLLAIAFSAFALGFVIPKLQYAMTAKRTGNNAAPGLREYNN
ncbi:MAG: hypothetical protein LUG16_05890, partial [Candidatus Gastranaerophilales bacterium]|nr:hypothetical protein [Candidatus Gastranaerophilales bacterium]